MEQEIPSLPPGQHHRTPKGQLILKPTALTFFNEQKQNYLLKVTFWGASCAFTSMQTPIAFPVVAYPLKFKLYLLESKSLQVEVVDSRNGKSIGCAFLNWSLYLRSMDDQQLNYETNKKG